VVSTDLGAGNYALPTCEVAGGDGGKLLHQPTGALGCATPTNPWISYASGTTNIPSGSPDPVQRVKDAFTCIARIGTGGCGFENPLEAARRALDPVLNVNPGFVRSNALLAVVFLTDEDDCSAKNTQLYDPSNMSFGQLASYRCTRFGWVCDQPLDTAGVKTGCVPGQSWLYPVSDYVSFFQGLKPAGKVFLAAIAGPPGPVQVTVTGSNAELQPSCTSASGTASGTAVPPLRIRAVLDALGPEGIFDLGIDAQNKPVPVDICATDYSPLMRYLGLKLAGAI